MADSEGNFGGNGSVVWKVDAYNSRQNSVKIKRRGNNVDVEPGNTGDRWEATGITEIDIGSGQDASGSIFIAGDKPTKPCFTVTIELPVNEADRQAILAAFATVATAGSDVGWVRFFLPIVSHHERQVVVGWPES